jgi:hypothetical protein
MTSTPNLKSNSTHQYKIKVMQWQECNKHNYLCINDSLNFFLVRIRVLQGQARIREKYHPGVGQVRFRSGSVGVNNQVPSG